MVAVLNVPLNEECDINHSHVSLEVHCRF